ncbi:MAG: ATP-binding cassette domain-containing protein [Methanomassiliicoccales archaeon]|nr:ATP-binding cassette domain-containing protein [Methanomassiliicoccales archaeon]
MITVESLTFTYAGSNRPVLEDVSTQVEEGEFVLVVGKSGCGKSTLCRVLNGLIPHFYGGILSGRVFVDGRDTRKTPPSRCADLIGMVFQDPENQLVMTNVENEMAFGLENLGVPVPEMKERVLRYADYFDLRRFFHRFIPELSGGEKQKVALGSVLAMNPKYLILDEPTSQLDAENAALFLDFLTKVNTELKIGVILVEHRLERCLRYADRVILMDNGRIIADGPKIDIVPSLKEHGLIGGISRTLSSTTGEGELLLSARNVHFSYDEVSVLDGADLDLAEGELVAITGANGSGKSTLIRQLNGLLRPQSGSVTVLGKDVQSVTTAALSREIGYLGQNPNDYLFEETLQKELEFTLLNLGVDEREWNDRIEWTLSELDLEGFRETFPRDLSCGQRERAALATVLVGRPKILVLDEPTRGLDYWSKRKLGSVLEDLRRQGMTTLLVTHDYRFIAENATRVLRLEEGRLSESSVDHMMFLALESAATGGT